MSNVTVEQILNPKLRRDKYIELREKGHTKDQIAEQYSIHKYSMNSKISHWGLSKWQPGEPVPPKPSSKPAPKESPTEIEQKVSLVFEEVPVESTDHFIGVSNMVEHPPHYTAGRVECIDAIESAVVGLDGGQAYLVGNIIKYMWRFKRKNGLQDLQKAEWYLKRLMEVQRETDSHTTSGT